MKTNPKVRFIKLLNLSSELKSPAGRKRIVTATTIVIATVAILRFLHIIHLYYDIFVKYEKTHHMKQEALKKRTNRWMIINEMVLYCLEYGGMQSQ